MQIQSKIQRWFSKRGRRALRGLYAQHRALGRERQIPAREADAEQALGLERSRN